MPINSHGLEQINMDDGATTVHLFLNFRCVAIGFIAPVSYTRASLS